MSGKRNMKIRQCRKKQSLFIDSATREMKKREKRKMK